jgi:hypothetical protein
MGDYKWSSARGRLKRRTIEYYVLQEFAGRDVASAAGCGIDGTLFSGRGCRGGKGTTMFFYAAGYILGALGRFYDDDLAVERCPHVREPKGRGWSLLCEHSAP